MSAALAQEIEQGDAALAEQQLEWLSAQILRNRFLPLPPQEQIFVGDGGFLAIGAYLARVARDLGGEGDGYVLVISADPRLDTPHAVRTWLARNRIPSGGPLRFLAGDEDEVRGYWNAWGFNGPSAECPEVVTAHLVAGSGVDTGILDLEARGPVQALTGPLTASVR